MRKRRSHLAETLADDHNEMLLHYDFGE
jgi:hypothetical protein